MTKTGRATPEDFEALLKEVLETVIPETYRGNAEHLLEALHRQGPLWANVQGFVLFRYPLGDSQIWDMLDAGSAWNENIVVRSSGFNNGGYSCSDRYADESDQRELASMIIESLCWSYDKRQQS